MECSITNKKKFLHLLIMRLAINLVHAAICIEKRTSKIQKKVSTALFENKRKKKYLLYFDCHLLSKYTLLIVDTVYCPNGTCVAASVVANEDEQFTLYSCQINCVLRKRHMVNA